MKWEIRPGINASQRFLYCDGRLAGAILLQYAPAVEELIRRAEAGASPQTRSPAPNKSGRSAAEQSEQQPHE